MVNGDGRSKEAARSSGLMGLEVLYVIETRRVNMGRARFTTVLPDPISTSKSRLHLLHLHDISTRMTHD